MQRRFDALRERVHQLREPCQEALQAVLVVFVVA